MPFCTCEDIALYYEVHGEGFPLLLVSGLGGGSWSWYGQVPFFEKFYRTITFDNRGAGQSSIPDGPYRMEQFAKDALCLLDHLELEEAFVLGLSMGGMIAQELAFMAPDCVRALLLGCTNYGGDLRIPPSDDVLQTLMNNEGLTHEQIIEKNLPLFFSEECLKHQPEVIASFRKAQLEAPQQPEAAFRAQLEAIGSFDACGRLSEIDIPTMIVTGSKDLLVPRENSYLMAEMIQNAELVVIPRAGHALHAECRDELNSLANHFFQCFTVENVSEGNR